MINNQESLAKVSKQLMFREPFYGIFLISLNKVWTKNVPTAGVTFRKTNHELLINPDFWTGLTPEKQQGLLKHELLHIAFFHTTDWKHLTDKKIANIAMDIEINQYIHASMLPEGGMTLDTFPELNLEPKKGTQYYYDKLKECQSELMDKIKDAMEAGESEITLDNGESLLIPDHSWGDEFKELSEAEQKLAKAQTGHVLKEVAEQVQKSQGNIPGELEDIIKKLSEIELPKFDWKGYIRRFAGKSTKVYTKKSRRKLNKRLIDFPGLKIKLQKHILVGIDTSGSVNKTELKEFLNEMHHMQKTGSEITIVQCDTAISHIGKFNPNQDFEVHGRGGTDFQPVIDYYNEHFQKFSCLFYLTDGECNAPQNAKGNILWVLSSQSEMNEDLPGSIIKLEL
jgi:predicted metal-dependent peptidase